MIFLSSSMVSNKHSPMLNSTGKRESCTYGDTRKYAVCKPYSEAAE